MFNGGESPPYYVLEMLWDFSVLQEQKEEEYGTED